MSARSAWVRLWWVWLVPAALILANAIWLLGVRGAVLGRGSLLVRERESLSAKVATLTAQREALLQSRRALDVLEADLGALRKDRLGSMRERLVSFLVDVAKRTHAAGLRPERISYTAEADKKTGMVHFNAIFALSGTYEEVRRCVALLESSPQFVIVERLMVRSEDSLDSIAVDVQLSVGTYFVDADTGMLRQLGIEDLPMTASARAPAPSTASAAAAAAAQAEPITDFTSVDTEVMEDLRTAVAGMTADEGEADGDLFVAAEPPPSRRGRSRSAAERKRGSDSFASQVGRREVSGGR